MELTNMDTELYLSCCGKSVCGGCVDSFHKSENIGKCPFCNAKIRETAEEEIKQTMKRVEANDAGAMCQLGNQYIHGDEGLLQDREKAVELWKKAAELGSSKAQFQLGNEYRQRGDSKKAKFHYEAAAMAGHEVARNNLGSMEAKLGNGEQAVKHFKIAASAGEYMSMQNLRTAFNKGLVSRNAMDSTLTAYNNSCAEMRSKARDAFIQFEMRRIERNNA
jgi:TPR repeat protein